MPAGVMDDYDRFSCSDVSDLDNMDDMDDLPSNVAEHSAKDNEVPKEGEDVGNMRIEFLGDNMAEAVENESLKKRRNETLAKDLEEESEMVRYLPWQWNSEATSDFDARIGPTDEERKIMLSQCNVAVWWWEVLRRRGEALHLSAWRNRARQP